MLIERPPKIYRLLFPGALWRKKITGQKTVYLTFDDGPIPEITPWVLDLLDKYNISATFFCVGDNVRKYPNIYRMVIDRGHRVGNHTFNHLQGLQSSASNYVTNTDLATNYIDSDLFRPPHGHMRIPQFFMLRKRYKIIMWDVVTRDYSKKITGEQVFGNVKRYVRDGSIIVFHDSLKADKNMKYALPLSIEWLQNQGYTFGVL